MRVRPRKCSKQAETLPEGNLLTTLKICKHPSHTLKHQIYPLKYPSYTLKHSSYTLIHRSCTLKHPRYTQKHPSHNMKHPSYSLKHPSHKIKFRGQRIRVLEMCRITIPSSTSLIARFRRKSCRSSKKYEIVMDDSYSMTHTLMFNLIDYY